jgi:solute:Na+ symporter, SSS family
MHPLDWTVLLVTLGFIVGYGMWRTRRTHTVERYLRGDNEDRWWAVTLSVMATQASAITFLSTPGQGFLEGLGFVQFYFGLPLAMVVIAWVFIPLFYKWKVFTAYEFIGKRFDERTRLLTAILFLVQRGLSTGLTIYAPSIVLSKVLHWPLGWTCVLIGGLVILYTTTGGAKAVGVTHKQQMAVMFAGLFVAFALLVRHIGAHATFTESLQLAGALGKMDIVDTRWDPAAKYTLWSGLIGGFFLQLSYFGTDQSQVQRYLGGQSVRQARVGLLTNGLLKIPMQFFILLIGVLVFVFYLFNARPIHWNADNLDVAHKRDTIGHTSTLEQQFGQASIGRAHAAQAWLEAERTGNTHASDTALHRIGIQERVMTDLQVQFEGRLKHLAPEREPNDKDYIFITWVMDHLPVGIVGLLLAMIFCAGMGSTSSQLSALATTAVVDVFRRSCAHMDQVVATKAATVAFGILALLFAAIFPLFDNLIQAVNILGSLFYGTILGIFLVAFFLKQVHGTAVFIAALVSQVAILILHFSSLEVAFLWYNLIAPAIVITLALVLQPMLPGRSADTA